MYCFQLTGQEEFLLYGFLVYITVTSGTAQVAMVLASEGSEGLRWAGGEYLTYDSAAVDEAYSMVGDVIGDVYAAQGLTLERVADIRRTTPDINYLLHL